MFKSSKRMLSPKKFLTLPNYTTKVIFLKVFVERYFSQLNRNLHLMNVEFQIENNAYIRIGSHY